MVQPQIPGGQVSQSSVPRQDGAGVCLAGVAAGGEILVCQAVENGDKLCPGEGTVHLEFALTASDQAGLHQGGGRLGGVPGEILGVWELVQHGEVWLGGHQLKGPGEEEEGLSPGDGLVQRVGEALVQQTGVDGLGNVLGIPGPFGDGKAGGVPLAGDVEHPAENGHCLGGGEAAVGGHGGGTAALQNAVFIGLLQGGFRPVAFHIGEILKGSLRSGGHPQDHGRGQDQGQQFFHGLFHLSFLPCWSHFQACPEGIWQPLPLVYWIF